jgi:prepilin-type processing-associated H-X9-DG protein
MDVVPAPPVVARSAPAKSGTPGWLIAAIIAVVAAVLLPTILILSAILFPVFAKAREKARQASCLSNMRQLSLACLQYASANSDTLPDAATWRQDIQPYLPGGFVWDCPSSCKGQQSYEFNPTLSGMSLGAIENPADTIMISEPLGPSGNGVHNRGFNIAFVDGHVRWMLPAQLSQLQGMSSAGGTGP